MRELRQRDALARRREQADIVDRFLGVAILRLIADDEVVARFALQHLADSVAADRGLDGVLHVGDVDADSGRRLRGRRVS